METYLLTDEVFYFKSNFLTATFTDEWRTILFGHYNWSSGWVLCGNSQLQRYEFSKSRLSKKLETCVVSEIIGSFNFDIFIHS